MGPNNGFVFLRNGKRIQVPKHPVVVELCIYENSWTKLGMDLHWVCTWSRKSKIRGWKVVHTLMEPWMYTKPIFTNCYYYFFSTSDRGVSGRSSLGSCGGGLWNYSYYGVDGPSYCGSLHSSSFPLSMVCASNYYVMDGVRHSIGHSLTISDVSFSLRLYGHFNHCFFRFVRASTYM